MSKFRCAERHCGWKGKGDELLRAPNPFDFDSELLGCPKCKEVDCVELVCDEPNCWKSVCCGTPTLGGYRWTCHEHRPETRSCGA